MASLAALAQEARRAPSRRLYLEKLMRFQRSINALHTGRLLAGALFAVFLAPTAALVQTDIPEVAASKPSNADLLQNITQPLGWSAESLTGPGGDFLLAATRNSQFVLAGEAPHQDDQIPLFDRAFFAALKRTHGFSYAAVEQDPIAIDEYLKPELRGDAARMAQVPRHYPTLSGFASDQDLVFLATAMADKGVRDPVWGLEQAQGPVRYLEELDLLAPTPALKTQVTELLVEARKSEATRADFARFLGLQNTAIMPKLLSLQSAWLPEAGSRAEVLLTGLVKSAEIYSYFIRAQAGEPVGLYNNTVREAWLKRGFMQHYRVAAAQVGLPKVFAKFGAWHMYRGRSPGSAWTLGNFLHEFATANDRNAFGVYVMALEGDKGWTEAEVWIRPLLPKDEPAGPIVIELEPLRPVVARFTEGLNDKDRGALRDLIHGFEALVIIPRSKPASFTMTGF